MELYQLQYFEAAARTGSMLAAASDQEISQPALSQQIKALETELGVQLLVRHARGVRLTEQGERVLQTTRHILAELEDLRWQVRRSADVRPSVIHMGIQPYLASERVTAEIKRFVTENPDQQVVTKERVNEQLLDLLLAGKVDFCLMTKPERWPPKIAAHNLFQLDHAAYCPSSHPLAGKKFIGSAELLPYPLLLFSGPPATLPTLRRLAQKSAVKLHVSVVCDQASTAFTMAAQGAGVALLPQVFGERAKRRGMKEVPVREPAFRISIAAVWRKKYSLPRECERLLAIISAANTKAAAKLAI